MVPVRLMPCSVMDLPLALAPVLSPVLILVLCVIAGVGTALLLPGKRHQSVGRIGGVLLGAAALIFVAFLVRQVSQMPEAATGGMGVYFWIFAAVAVFGAIRVVTHAKPVYAALYFVLAVIASAGLFILLWAEFMAAALVVIYAGAILVTYVFVIMLAQQTQVPGQSANVLAVYDRTSREPVMAAAVGFTLMGILLFVIFDRAQRIDAPHATAEMANVDSPFEGSTQQLGHYLFEHQMVNLELAGLLLTISMVGAIVIARRRVIMIGSEAHIVESESPEIISAKPPRVDDNPHSIPVTASNHPGSKVYPER